MSRLRGKWGACAVGTMAMLVALFGATGGCGKGAGGSGGAAGSSTQTSTTGTQVTVTGATSTSTGSPNCIDELCAQALQAGGPVCAPVNAGVYNSLKICANANCKTQCADFLASSAALSSVPMNQRLPPIRPSR